MGLSSSGRDRGVQINLGCRCNGQIGRLLREGPCWRKEAPSGGITGDIWEQVDSEACCTCPWGTPGCPRLAGSHAFVSRDHPPTSFLLQHLPPPVLCSHTCSALLSVSLPCWTEICTRAEEALSCWLCVPGVWHGDLGLPEPPPPTQQAEGVEKG